MTSPISSPDIVFGTEDLLRSLCQSVTQVLGVATQSELRYSGMVQRISKTSLKPDIGCFVLFDGGFSGLVIINFTAPAALEIYRRYLTHMGLDVAELATSHTSEEVSNVMGELMNQMVGDFTGKIGRELQTHITQNQPKMLALNKQVVLSVDTHLDNPEARRVSFFTADNHVFYLEFAVDGTEFLRLHNFEVAEAADPDAILEQAKSSETKAGAAPVATMSHDDLVDQLGL